MAPLFAVADSDLGIMTYMLNVLWLLVSLFLILIILLQRGKGGGLVGALGGMGGSSAFGTKAGDVFTKITVCVFVVWLTLAMVLVHKMSTEEGIYTAPDKKTPASKTAPPDPQPEAP